MHDYIGALLTWLGKDKEELTINASVRHPNCVVVVAACEDRSDPIYVMEWMSGGSLHEALGKLPPPPLHVRLRNAREIASAVDYLHRRFITHGDLKSLNVMLTSDLIAKICDFGAAIQRLNSAVSMVSSPSAQGTIQWSAPELFQAVSANLALTCMLSASSFGSWRSATRLFKP